MNIKQFLLLATAFTCITNGLTATETPLTVQEIAEGIITNKISIDDPVLYDGALYKIAKFEKYDTSINYTLERSITFFNIQCGKETVYVDIREEKSLLDKPWSAHVDRTRKYNENYYILHGYTAGSAFLTTVVFVHLAHIAQRALAR